MTTTNTDIKPTVEQLQARVAELETALLNWNGNPSDESGETPPKDAAALWLAIEGSLTYGKGYNGKYHEVVPQVIEDAAKMGRILQEVTFAHLCRTSKSDFDISHGAGEALSKNQFEEIYFFIDRLSSMMFRLIDTYHKLSAQEEEDERKRKN